MKAKFNAYEKTLDAFINKILIVCPKCEKMAQVIHSPDNKVSLTCLSCAFNKAKEVTIYSLGTNKDPFFSHTLWLQKNLQEGVLWAYNFEHLTFLENHISAALRERDIDHKKNQSIGSRLPKWMASKKNRKEVLQGIRQLRKR